MVDVLTSIVIDRPVAAYASDPANAPESYADIDTVRQDLQCLEALLER